MVISKLKLEPVTYDDSLNIKLCVDNGLPNANYHQLGFATKTGTETLTKNY